LKITGSTGYCLRVVRVSLLVSSKNAVTLGVLFLLCSLQSCRTASPEPVTLTFLDPEWSHDLQERRLISDAALQEFTKETGIRVKHLPAPETSPAQLALIQQLLQKGAVSPDVYGVDVVWPAILGNYLVDLKPYFTKELSAMDPALVANYTVDNKLVAMPYHANIGILFYRTDLLHKYGYREPPKTWDELEKMAARIQNGERAKGDRDFWGFVWPGAASEGLTCVALEWQVADGGGRIIEADKKVSVNNPESIHAWERAAHWVGWISPPSVLLYQEWDAANAFSSNRAAFFRGWTSDYFLSHPPDSPINNVTGETSVPGGKTARAGTLGGFGLGVSRSSAHRPEAIKLVEFLARKEAELDSARSQTKPPDRPELYELPTLLRAYASAAGPGEAPGGGVVTRPSTITGDKYDDVAQAYVQAVHSVLEGKSKAPDAAAELQKRLVAITGFQTGRQ
jgi:trehalose/maltose transport system substrate-binding protein